jgi:hypothetical protein
LYRFRAAKSTANQLCASKFTCIYTAEKGSSDKKANRRAECFCINEAHQTTHNRQKRARMRFFLTKFGDAMGRTGWTIVGVVYVEPESNMREHKRSRIAQHRNSLSESV